MSLATACCFNASASDALFGRLCTPFCALFPFDCAAGAAFASFERTKSAHDFGAAGFGGDLGASTDEVSAAPSTTATGSVCEEVVSAEAGVGCCAPFSVEGDALFAFCRPLILGTAIAVLVSFLACCCAGGPDGFGEDGTTCAGVVGVDTWLKSLSDGACDVAGVSRAEVAATVDVSEAGSSCLGLVGFCGNDSDS